MLNGAVLYAQDYLIRNQNFTVGDPGFSSHIFYYPFQDQKGYIWVGTDHGLDRYDGTQVRHFPFETHGLRFKSEFRISEDAENNLWLHYQHTIKDIRWTDGVDVFDPVQGKAIPLNDYLEKPLPFPEDQITWVNRGPDQSMLLSTKSGSVYAIKSRQAKKVYQVPSGEKIHQLFLSGSDGIWLVLWREVIRFDQSWAEVKRFNKSSGNPVTQLDILDTPYEDESGQLHYVALSPTPNDKEFRRHFVDGKVKVYSQKHQGNDYTALAVSPKTLNHYFNYIKIDPKDSTKRLYLVVISPDGDEIYRSPGAIRVARRPYFDNQDKLWLTTHHSMKNLELKRSHFRKYIDEFRTSLNERYSTESIIEDGQGNLLVNGLGNSYSVDLITKERRVLTPPFAFNHPFSSQEVSYLNLDFAKDEHGDIWISNESFRLLRYEVDKGRFTEFTYPESLFEGLDRNQLKATDVPTQHRALFFDKRGTLWLGHKNGISVFNADAVEINWLKNEGAMEALAGAEVIDIYENSHGLWLSTTRGVYVLDPVNRQILGHYHRDGTGKNRLPHNEINHLYEDQSGTFWLATNGAGLIQWWPDEGRYEQFTTEHGLSTNYIYAVYEDNYQNLWLPSDKGLNQFNPLNGNFITHTLSDGIAHMKFNLGAHYRGNDSTLYFGGFNGVTSFKPEEIVSTQHSENTALVVTALTKRIRRTGELMNEYPSFLDEGEIVLQPTEQGFNLEVSHLSYGPLANQSYAYQIAGVEAGWTYLNEPVIRINALPYGEFQLLVKAKESTGVWTEALAIPLVVIRPIFLRPWFILLCSLIIASLTIYLVRRRITRLKRHRAALEKEVAERTSEIKQQTIELEQQTVVLEKQAKELKQLDAAKSQFFANISHELRTPLTLIMGPLTELLKEKTLDEDKLYKLKRMYRSSKGLSDLVEEILELSKLEAGKLEVHESPVVLMPFLIRLYSGFESFAIRKGVKYTSDFYFDDQVVLSLDSRKVEKIVNNLLSNALKFTDRGGFVKITARLKADSLKITVRDSGRGIAEKDLPFVFDRFFQTQERDLTKVQGGTGIGLALVKELTTVMKGTIGVESEVGKGTTFELNLPKKVVTDADVPGQTLVEELLEDIPYVKPPGERADEAGHSLLIVEDNPDMQEYIKELLTPHYQVKTADNGLEALEVLKSFTPDLVVSDVMMPEMDGFTLLKRLKSNQLYRHLPVVMLTARAEHEDKLHALTIGVDDYLTKPFLGEELLARIKNLLSNYQARKAFLNKEKIGEPDSAYEVSEEDTQVVSEVDLEWVKTVEKEALYRLTDTNFSVEVLADFMNLSTRQFQRKIKSITGLTNTQFLQELRLQQARAYLERGAYHTVAEVSYAIGFQSVKHFSQLFKKRYGKSPGEYLRA